MVSSIDRRSHHLRLSVIGGTVVLLDGIQHMMDGCFSWLRKELRAGQYRLDPGAHGSPDLFKFGPMEMTPGRSAIIEAALQHAKERSPQPL